ncbi:MAG: hypothetical protein ACE5KE_07975 [Methanosarcinales archaeon]
MGFINKVKALGTAGLIYGSPYIASVGVDKLDNYIPDGPTPLGVDYKSIAYGALMLGSICVGLGLYLIYDL